MTMSHQLVGERYELLAPIAGGGMGTVWRAQDALLGRPVAVKVLRGELGTDPTFRARFRAEAQHAALLTHPNIATVFDYGEVESGGDCLAYLVMELVEGEPLSALLAQRGRLGTEFTLDVVRQTAAALAAAHAAGVVHRDVKPANILVRTDGAVKITDFGIALSAASAPLTRTGQVIGTAHYLAPEQATGEKATPGSDVYALGAVAYECLAGHRPIEGESAVQIALKQIHEQPDPLPADVPADVRTLVGHAMAKDPTRRFPDAGALLAAVDQVRGGLPTAPGPSAPGPNGTAVMAAPLTGHATRPIGAAPRPAGERTGSARPRFPWPLLVGVVVALALIGVVVGLAGSSGRSTAAPPPSTRPATPTTTAPSSTTTRAVAVSAGTLVGRPVADVQAALVAQGLQVNLTPVPTSSVPAGQVTAISPAGSLPPGSTVTVSYAVAPVVTQAPAPAPAKGKGHGKKHDG